MNQPLALQVKWQTLGNHFGYPECCVQQFLKDTCAETKSRFPDGPWVGTGYIPCPHCAEIAKDNFYDFVETVIEPARLADASFPQEGSETLIEDAVSSAFEKLTFWQRLRITVEDWVQALF